MYDANMKIRYGDLVVFRGDPNFRSRKAVRVYAADKTSVYVILPDGCGVAIKRKYVHKAKRDTVKAREAWILR